MRLVSEIRLNTIDGTVLARFLDARLSFPAGVPITLDIYGAGEANRTYYAGGEHVFVTAFELRTVTVVS